MDRSVLILYPSPESLSSTDEIETDEILISADVSEKLYKLHPLPNPTMVVIPRDTFPKIACLIGYTLDDAILLYRQLFYSTWEISPPGFDTDKLSKILDYIDKWSLNSVPVIVDYGGSFETKHLHSIQYAFPQAVIYSVDTLYATLDLLILQINQDATKWCIIPVFNSTSEVDQLELVECLCQELIGKSSISTNIQIDHLELFKKIYDLRIYDPYSEILSFKNIYFVDSLEKCSIVPCSIFMAYNTYDATPTHKSLLSLDLIDPTHTRVDMCNDNGGLYYSRKHFSQAQSAKPTTCNLCNRTKWDNISAKLSEIDLILPIKPNVYPLPRTDKINWLGTSDITKFLCGKRYVWNSNYIDSMAHLFRIKKTQFLQHVDCLNLSSLLTENHIENVTAPIVQQFIEQHVNDFWKNNDQNNDILQKCPKTFLKECLHELLGPINNLRIYIECDEDIVYSSELIRQMKHEDSNLHIEYSYNEYMETKTTTIYESAIILVFESNQNYVLVFGELERFFKYISTCTSLKEICQRIESSVAFVDQLGNEQNVKWHQNLSFVYVAAHQESLIQQTEDSLLKLGLKDINFISKKLKYLDYDELSQQSSTNQAVICFNYSSSPELDCQSIPWNRLDQWIFDKDKCKFTGPIISMYPKVSTHLNLEYPQDQQHTHVGYAYSLLCDQILILIQWRN
ncbi:hypothetical protein I4U23_005859 [Adineta vaga]|nr:hypothetical protein I4U23_005859 [Adineta vaga]